MKSTQKTYNIRIDFGVGDIKIISDNGNKTRTTYLCDDPNSIPIIEYKNDLIHIHSQKKGYGLRDFKKTNKWTIFFPNNIFVENLDLVFGKAKVDIDIADMSIKNLHINTGLSFIEIVCAVKNIIKISGAGGKIFLNLKKIAQEALNIEAANLLSDIILPKNVYPKIKKIGIMQKVKTNIPEKENSLFQKVILKGIKTKTFFKNV